MLKMLPKITIVSTGLVGAGYVFDLPIEATLIGLVLAFAFLLDVLFVQWDNNRKAMLWFLEHVHITDKPLGESDAPESLKKLLRRGGDNKNG